MVDLTQNTIPVELAPEQDAGIPVEGNQSPSLPPNVAAPRADKAAFGLAGKVDKSYDDYYTDFLNGQEQAARDYAATTIDAVRYNQRNNLMLHMFKQKGSALTAEEVKSIDDVVSGKTDPDTVFEQHYAQEYMNHLKWPLQDPDRTSWLKDAFVEMPKQVQADINVGTNATAIRTWLETLHQDNEEFASKQSWPGWLIDRFKDLTSVYPMWKRLGFPDTSILNDSLENVKNNVKVLNDQYRKDNPALASEFTKYLLGESTTEKFLHTILPLAVPGVEVGLGAAAISKIGLFNAERQAVRQMIKAAAGDAPAELAAPIAAGNMDEVVSRSVLRNAAKRLLRRSDPLRDAMEYLPSIFKLANKHLAENPGNGGAAGITALEEANSAVISQLPGMIRDAVRVERLPGIATGDRASVDAAKDTLKQLFPNTPVINVSEPYKVLDNWFMDMHFSKNLTEYFGNEGAAAMGAKRLGLDGWVAKNDGAGWYISKPMPINETSPGLRDFYAKLEGNKTPDSVVNAFMGRLRTPEETMSDWQIKNRGIASYAGSNYLKYIQKQLSEVEALGRFTIPGTSRKQRWDDFEAVLDSGRKIISPDTGKPGYTFKNPGELEYHYMKTIGRLPDKQEIAAYFAIKRAWNIDHALRIVSEVRNKNRNGVMSMKFKTVNGKGEDVYSPEFEAVPVDHFPVGSSHAVAIITDHPGEEILTFPGRMGKSLDKYKEQVKRGELKVARIYAPEYAPLGGYGKIKDDHYLVWVVAKNFETKPISWASQLPEQGGGHQVYDATHWMAQARIKHEFIGQSERHIYIADRKVMPFNIPKLGREVTALFEQVRLAIKNKDIASAKNIVENILHMDWKDVYSKFVSMPTRDRAGRWIKGKEPLFDLEEPFQLIENNKTLIDTDKGMEQRYAGKFVDGTKSGSMRRQFQTEFTGERDAYDLYTINDIGTKGNPVYNYEPAKLVSAIPTMNRALGRISNSLFMDDYKMYSVEHWLREASKLLDVKDSNLRVAPLYWFHHAEFNKGLSSEDAARVAQLEIVRKQIKMFMGQASDTDALLHNMSQKLMDSLYERLGPKAAKWVDPAWMLHTLQDPTRYLRAMTFHMKMGLFSIPQILVQGNTYVNIFGIAGPTRALQGTAAALMHQWSRINESPAVLQAMDRHLTNFGWRPGEYLEARQAALDAGFFNVGREYSMRDDIMSNKVISTAWGKFLHMGTFPFVEGERGVRMGAWYTAYKEFRDTNPTGRLSNADTLGILERARLLNANMDRAGNALYQKGWTSLPTQFLTYTIRQAELMWGHRLTSIEKARLLFTNAVVYGLPTGLGITGLPSEWWIRQNALENGYVVGDNYIESMVTEGIPSTLLALVNGGRYYNIPERFGTGGITNISEAMRSDKTIWDQIGGASYSTLKSMWDAGDGFRQWMMSGIRGEAPFNITQEHVADIGKEITSFNSAFRAIVALKTGEWRSKKGATLENDISPLSAILMTLSGVQPQSVSDLSLLSNAMEEEKAVQKYAEQKFIMEYHRGLRAADNNDPEGAKAFFENAFTYMDVYIPTEEKEKVLAQASKDWETVIERVSHVFYNKDVPPYLKDIRRQAGTKLLQQRNP